MNLQQTIHDEPGFLESMFSIESLETLQNPSDRSKSLKNGTLKFVARVKTFKSIPGNTFVKSRASVPNIVNAPREIIPWLMLNRNIRVISKDVVAGWVKFGGLHQGHWKEISHPLPEWEIAYKQRLATTRLWCWV